MPDSLRIGRIAGIEISLHISWLIIVVLLTWSLATGWFATLYPGWALSTYWIISVLASLLLFGSVLVHELAHSLVARARGLPVKNITLFIFGGISNIEREPQSPGVEFQMALVGPLTSLAIGGLAFLLMRVFGGAASPLSALLGYLAVMNILLGIFNLLPGFPLDGGRVLRSIVWKLSGNSRTATRVATIAGQLVAYLLIFAGLVLFFEGDLFDGIWLGFIGWFLLSGAQSANTQSTLETMFKGVTVGEVMNSRPATVPANISLRKLVDEYLLPQGWRSVCVLQGDQLAGLITLSDVRHIPQEQWTQTPVGFVLIPLEKLHIVAPEQSLNEVLPLMVAQDVNQIPVVTGDRLVGVLSREDMVRFVEVRRGLGLERGSRSADGKDVKDGIRSRGA
ncbi:MAG TPA: site-2 protease family protein [Ktedonobacteraceae bacterium]|nr:site-2 protease family protein [Ktedonobacteraceae bacterium]